MGVEALRGLTLLLPISGGLSIFVALDTALHQREGDRAMLRVIGAGRAATFGQVMWKVCCSPGVGALLGVLLGHAVTAIAVASTPRLRTWA